MNTYFIGYDKNDIKHEQDLIQFKSKKHAILESDEWFNVTASSVEIAKQEYHSQRSHWLTKIYM